MAEARGVPVTATGDVSGVLDNHVCAWNFAETAGATANVVLRDEGVGGTIIIRVNLAANESVGEHYAIPLGLKGQLHATVTGTVVGTVWAY